MKILRYAILIILVAAFVWPQNAFAADSQGVIEGTLAELLQIINFFVLEFLRSILVNLISKLGSLLDSVLNLKITYGGATVYIVWKLLRDICNSLFIVLFVFIAFGTIFNVLWKNPYHYASALKGVILAAILINFSLPIGQTVLWAGNEASLFVLGLFPKSSVGADIVTALDVPNVALANIAPAAPVVPVTSMPIEKFTQTERQNIEAWIKQGQTVPLNAIRNCLETSNTTKRSPAECYKIGWNYLQNETAQAAEKDAKAQARTIAHPLEIAEYWYTAWQAGDVFGGKITKLYGTANLKQEVARFINGVFALILLLTVVLSFACIIAFMVARIPMAWLLLSVSAPAVFTLGIPGAKTFRTWMGNLIGWSIFSPLYLFVVYIGLFMLSQSGSLTASLSNQDLPFFAGALGNTLFFVIAGFIFIYGAKWAMSTAFKFSDSAKSAFGSISSRMGVSEDSMYGIKTAARLSGAKTVYDSARATAAAERANLAQLGRNAMDSRYLGVPQWMRPKSYEQMLAEKKAARGVYGADKEVADISAKQVTDEAGKQKSAMANMDKAAQLRYLKSMMNSPNRSAALAAREELLKRGKLDKGEYGRTRAMYPNEGARKAWDDKVKRAPGAAAREKKKEAEEKRADIIATVGTMDFSKMKPAEASKAIKEMLDPVFKPKSGDPDAGDMQSYIEAVGLQDPTLLHGYLSANGIPSAEAKAFSQVIKKPENILDLPEHVRNNRTKLADIARVVQARYPAGKKRDRVRDRLLTSRPEMDALIRQVFP